MCDMDLVYTDSLIIDNAMAFPILPELGKCSSLIAILDYAMHFSSHLQLARTFTLQQKASGFSYWMYMADKYHGVSLAASKAEYKMRHDLQPKCDVELSMEAEEEGNDYTQITPKNMVRLIF